MKVGYVYDPIYLKHDTEQHVENAARLEAIMAHLKQTQLISQLTPLKPRAASIEELSRVHHPQYISYVREVAQGGGGWLDPDTVMSTDSYDAALYAAGGAIKATEAVITGEVASAFALVRPPGHHATASRAMGFCLFNNLAVAAKYALDKYRLERIAIIDFDVHHGNGTHDTFYDNPQVLYTSTHQYHLYPGTGDINQIGKGEAQGTTINIPMPAGCGDNEYLEAFEQIISPAVRRFQPRLILLSAGYDAHWGDGLALMQVSISGFARMVTIIKRLADELCAGHLALTLEGGYNLQALTGSVQATFAVLLGRDSEDPLGKSPPRWVTPNISALIKSLKEIHHLS